MRNSKWTDCESVVTYNFTKDAWIFTSRKVDRESWDGTEDQIFA